MPLLEKNYKNSQAIQRLSSSLAWHPDGTTILTGSLDGTARLWDITTGKELKVYKIHTREIRVVAFSPDGQIVITGSADNTACLWKTSTGECLKHFKEFTGEVNSVAWSPNEKLSLSDRILKSLS